MLAFNRIPFENVCQMLYNKDTKNCVEIKDLIGMDARKQKKKKKKRIVCCLIYVVNFTISNVKISKMYVASNSHSIQIQAIKSKQKMLKMRWICPGDLYRASLIYHFLEMVIRFVPECDEITSSGLWKN